MTGNSVAASVNDFFARETSETLEPVQGYFSMPEVASCSYPHNHAAFFHIVREAQCWRLESGISRAYFHGDG